MNLFLLTFFLIYGGVHVYFFARVRGAFAPGLAITVCLILFLVMMVVAPILVRVTEKAGLEVFARVLAYAGYCWMGFLFLFFAASLLTDLYRLLAVATGMIAKGNFKFFPLSPRGAFLISSSFAVCIAVFGYFDALRIRTDRIVIKSPKIPAEIGRIRLVQISDVHLGLIVRGERMRRIIREIRGTEPDILVSTGDLVDGQIDGLAGMVDSWREIKPRFGKYAVTGNHEYYAGIDQALDFTTKAGFTVLQATAADTAGITLAGVNDPAGERPGHLDTISEQEVLSRLSRERFTVLLKHRPLAAPDSIGLFDLQLSGHVHKGQIFPFRLITRLFYPFLSGYRQLSDNSAIYVNRGTGTWGPPVRFLASPEITVIELVHGAGEGLSR